MKVLYVAGGFEGSTTIDRKIGLEVAGWDITHMDSDPWGRIPSRVWRGIHNKLNSGPLIWQFNRNILSEAKELLPEIVWIDKGIWVSPNTLKKLQAMGILVAHYTPDAAIQYNATRLFLKSIPLYDVLFTSKRWELEDYRRLGAKRIEVLYQGTDVSRTRPMQLKGKDETTYECDVVFVGRGEEHYAQTILSILKLVPDLNLKIWGPWQVMVERYPKLKPYWQGRSAMGDEYAKALSGAKLAMGMLSKLFPESETTRTFEIPACATMLLAERTESHQALFDEGVEAEFYDSPEEAAEKIKCYLANEAKLRAIADAGYRRFLNSDYTTYRFMKECVSVVERLVKTV